MKSTLRKTVSVILATVCIAAVISLGLIIEPAVKIYGFAELDENRLDNIRNTLVISDDDNRELSNTQYTSLADVNDYTINAFLCAEDKRFFEHEGVDYARILSAAVNDVKNGAFSQGASTITQQLIKNTHLSNDKTLIRKLQEIRLSRAIERKYSKNDILEKYLNVLYFGSGTYGIGNAAQNFFGKSVSKLSLKESAMLASIINNPSLYSPYSNQNNLIKRTELILKLMKNNRKITEKEYKNALTENVKIVNTSLYNKYKYFVIREACSVLGCTEEYLLHNNYKICCNQNFDLQNKIASYLEPHNAECLQVIVINNKTGQIIAHEAKYKGNPAYIVRSPGSTIKPIVCYAPAIEKNLIVPITPILDEKTDFFGYSPSNYQDKYHGWVSCEYALKESLNIPAVKLLDSVGLNYAKKFASDMGIKASDDEGLALALGGMKYGTSLRDITQAYTVFARSGTKIKSSYIKAIYLNDKLIYTPSHYAKRIMKEETAYLINEMLFECAKSGSAKIINSKNLNWAAKTGTVGTKRGNTDAYCIAYSPDYTIGVHVMNDATATGGGLPTKIAKKLIMSDIICNKPFDKPHGIRKIEINAIEYYNNQKVIEAKKSLPKKDKISASFPIFNLPAMCDERNDYQKGLDLFDMNNFTIVDGFFD